MKNFGVTVKEIRTSKGLTQQYISNGSNMTQSNYSKFEKNLLDVRSSTFMQLLDTIDIPLQEFMYIHNDNKLSLKENLLNTFFNTSFHNVESLKEIKNHCEAFEHEYTSSAISELKVLCEALIIIYEDNDFIKARKTATPIWNRLSENNNLYLYDLYFLNAILYIFSVDEAIHLRKFLLRNYSKYKDYPNTTSIFINTYINTSILLIDNKMYEEALKDLDFVQEICKEKRLYFQLALIYIRKGICISNLTGDGHAYIDKGLQYLEMFEEKDAYTMMKEEIKTSLMKEMV